MYSDEEKNVQPSLKFIKMRFVLFCVYQMYLLFDIKKSLIKYHTPDPWPSGISVELRSEGPEFDPSARPSVMKIANHCLFRSCKYRAHL